MSGQVDKTIAIDIGTLAGLDLMELRQQWPEHYGCEAPRNMSPQLLRLAIAYRVQEKAFGGLSKALQTQLQQAAFRETGNGQSQPSKGARRNVRFHYKPGTRLLREWQGRTHEVIVVEDGDFLYLGNRYRSLSRIAREISGTHWSGPNFFGLNQPRETTARAGGDFDG